MRTSSDTNVSSPRDELTPRGQAKRSTPMWKRHRWLAPVVYSLVVALAALALGAFNMYGQAPQTPGGAGVVINPAHTATARPTTPARTTTPAPTATPASVTVNGVTCSITSQDIAAQSFLLNLLNQHRAAAHVKPLALNSVLTRGAEAHSCDMYRHQSLNHMGSDGSSPQQRIAATGVTFSNWGENIGSADNYGLDGGVTTIDNAMMSEPLEAYNHHYNIVNASLSQVGLGIIYANGQVWLTEDFIG